MIDEVEDLGGAGVDARLTADAAIIVDRVQQREHLLEVLPLEVRPPPQPVAPVVEERAETEQHQGYRSDREGYG
ncbi:MAG: hypothetical protein R3B48_26310 [Kofleriaceae bacterium]